jgi:hypothetical protein
MAEGKEEEEDMVTIPVFEVMWELAPESMTQSEGLGGGLRETVLKALARAWGSHGDQAGGAW